ncbi:MAG: aminopeptidase P family protein [Acidimicrobiia bacterium]|nr:M24 family metallopeptidase [Actinomycetota bacterium]MBL6925879.1 aminopeptidase P family protein [Acidimicrobiia bacterium]
MTAPVLPPMEVGLRLNRLRAGFDDAGCGALLVTSATNIGYLTGFTGSAGVLWVDTDRAVLVTDGRYTDQAPGEVAAAGADVEVEIAVTGRQKLLAGFATEVTDLGLETDTVTWAEQRRFAGWFADTSLTATDGLVETLRQIKDAGELARIKAAAAIADEALAEVWPMLDTGPTERQVASAIDDAMRRRGASDRAFETIVAAGPNSAHPHARPGDRTLTHGDLVVCDLGAMVDGYRSDMTRSTRIGGTGDGPEAEMLTTVLAAQQAGIEAVVDGVAASAVDMACRQILEEAGLGDAFIHGTGHGVGLDIHEAPALSGTSTATLRCGQVVTVEPGAYITGLGGVRWEDTVVVGSGGCQRLTRSPSTT